MKLAGALALLMTCAAEPAAGQINLRRTIQRAAAGPSPEVRQLLDRIAATQTRFDQATFLLSQSSLVMEGVVATEDRRAEIRRELESAGTLEQRTGENRVQLQAEDRTARLEQATQERRYEQRQLSAQQSSNVNAAVFNAALAAKYNADALGEARHLAGEASRAAQSLASDPANLPYANRLTMAATQQLPSIINAVPVQARLASAIVGAAQQARSANQAVQVTEVAPAGASPQPIDVNAI